jgi:hypothetical protein
MSYILGQIKTAQACQRLLEKMNASTTLIIRHSDG